MNFFTNVAVRGGKILLRGIRDGKRFRERVPYQPAIFIPREDGDWRDIHGKPLKMRRTESIVDARNIVDGWKSMSNRKSAPIDGLDRWEYAFLNERYPGDLNYDRSKIDIAFLD